MAIIDLRNVTIVIKDGYEGGSYPFTPWLINQSTPTETGYLVNHGGGYTATTTTIAVDTGTGTVTEGDEFTIFGEAGLPVHTVATNTVTAGSGNITFTPGIATGGVADDAALSFVPGYSIGATTIAVDTGNGALADGDSFTIAGEFGLPTHTVTAHTETDGNTTSIVFTPATVTFVPDDQVLTFFPHSQTVHIGEGNMTYSEKRKIKYVTDRGILNTVKLEEDQPLEAKLAYEWDFLTSSISEGIPTTEDVFKFRNLCANWVSTSPDKCEIPCVDIVLYNTPPCNGVSAEQIILHMFRWEDLAHDPKAGTVDVTGKCNTLTALVSRIPT